MDALARITAYFPAQSLTSFWILSNLIMSNQACTDSTKGLMVALIVIFCIFVIFASFTDTYTGSNNTKYVVLLLPFYGPVCFSLPSDFDKDRVYDHFYLKVRDYIRAFIAMTCFLLIVIFISPISICLFPADGNGGVSSLDPAVVRTVPVVVAIAGALIMMCLGNPRQCLGYQNVEETCPAIEKQMGDNPIYSQGGKGLAASNMGYPGPPPSIPEEDDYQDGPPQGYNNYNGPVQPQASYTSNLSGGAGMAQGNPGSKSQVYRSTDERSRGSHQMVPVGRSGRHDPNQSSGDIGAMRQSNMSSRSMQGADM